MIDILLYILVTCSDNLINNLLKCIKTKQNTQTYDYLLKQANVISKSRAGTKERMDAAFKDESLVNSNDPFADFYNRYDNVAGDPCYRYSKKAMETYLKNPYYCLLCYVYFMRCSVDEVDKKGTVSENLATVYNYLREQCRQRITKHAQHSNEINEILLKFGLLPCLE